MKKLFFIGLIFFFCISSTVSGYTVPDTGQDVCYDDWDIIICPEPGDPYYGQDANYSINPMSFTKLDSEERKIILFYPGP